MDPRWEELHSSKEWGKYPGINLIQTVMRCWRDPEARRGVEAFELGCGTGANLSFLLNEGFQVSAIDGSPSAIERAKSRLSGSVQENQRFDIQACTFEDYDYLPERFDLVIDYCSLCTNPYAVIEETIAKSHAMLKEGGMFFSLAWGRNCEGANPDDMYEDGTVHNITKGPASNTGTIHYTSPEEIDKLYKNYSKVDVKRIVTEHLSTDDGIIEEYIVWAKK